MRLRTYLARPGVWTKLTTAVAIAGAAVVMVAAGAAADEPAKRPQQASDKCVVAELAAGGYCGDRGPAERAGLAAPRDVSYFSNGDLLIADGQNSAIRRVSRVTGAISTVAGLGVFGDDPPATPTPVAEVALADPRGVAALPDGSFAIADAGLRAVLLVTPEGIVRTLLRNLELPTDVAVLDENSLVVTDTRAGRVIKVDLDGRRRTLAQRLNRPWQIAVEQTGALIVSQVRPTKRTRTKSGKRRTIRMRGNVVRIPPGGGRPTVLAGPGATGPAGALRFDRVSGVAALVNGGVLVADRHVVQMIAPDGATSAAVGGDGYAADSYLGQAEGIAYRDGTLAIADAGTNQVYRVPLDPAGPVTAIGIDVADPPIGASARSMSGPRYVKRRAARRQRIVQKTGRSTGCIFRKGMSRLWAPSFERSGTIIVDFNRRGTIKIAAAKASNGPASEIGLVTFPGAAQPYRLRRPRLKSGKPLPRGSYVRVLWRGGCVQTKMSAR